jgi:hypothetical protein
MRIKGLYLVIVLLLACVAGRSQRFSPLSFSPIANSSGGATVTSSPFVLAGKGKCFTATSGLAVLGIANNGKGEFSTSCEERPPVADVVNFELTLKLFPNPTTGPVTLKCEGNFDVNLFCQIKVVSMDGRTMMSQMVPMKDVKAGFVFNTASYAAGTYAVVIDFMSHRYNVKLIKV